MAQQNGMIKSVTDVNFLYPNQFNLQPQNAFPADPFMPQNLAYQLQYFSFMPQMQSWNQQLPADRHQQLNRDAPILPTSVDPPQHALSLLPNPSTSRDGMSIFEIGEASSSSSSSTSNKRSRVESITEENTGSSLKRQRMEWNLGNQDNKQGMPSDRSNRNSIYDPLFEGIGLPIDPHLRMLALM